MSEKMKFGEPAFGVAEKLHSLERLENEEWVGVLIDTISPVLNDYRVRAGKQAMEMPVEKVYLVNEENFNSVFDVPEEDGYICGQILDATGEIFVAAKERDTFELVSNIVHELIHSFAGTGLNDALGRLGFNMEEALTEDLALDIMFHMLDTGVLVEEELDEGTVEGIKMDLEGLAYTEDRKRMDAYMGQAAEEDDIPIRLVKENWRVAMFAGVDS